MPEFRTRNGRLTSYALACGYIETASRDQPGFDIEARLWMEHGAFHVRSHDHTAHMRLQWDVANTVTEARRLLAEHCRRFGLKRKAIAP